MAPYIGTSTPRVDGFAKVTGAAKYAAEFNVPGLAYGSVVTSIIAKGRIVRIDPSAALRVKGVLDVLTHENRPPIAGNDEAYKDETAPTGSPFRPLYDSRIMFSGQPIALVVAETSEIARFAASLVRVEYETDGHITDVYRRREAATPVKPPTNPIEALFTPPKTRGRPEISVAVGLELDGDTIKEGRFALGGIAHRPWRDPQAEAALRGQPANPATFARAADVLLRDAKGYEHNTFKIDLARRCIARALTQAVRGTPQSQSSKKIV